MPASTAALEGGHELLSEWRQNGWRGMYGPNLRHLELGTHSIKFEDINLSPLLSPGEELPADDRRSHLCECGCRIDIAGLASNGF